VLAFLPVAAYAHAQLIGSNPTPGAILPTLPATVELYFSENVAPAGRGITVYGPDGRMVQDGTARVQGTRLAVKLKPGAEGTYAVIWTVVGTDTDPSRGVLTFSVGHVSAVRAPGLGGADGGLVSRIGLILQAVSHFLHFAGFALGFGAATYALFIARSPRPLHLAAGGVVMLLAAAPLALLAQTASLDVAQTFDGDALISALGSSLGRLLGLQVAAALLLWAVLGALRQAPWLRWSIPGLGLALAVVDATAAHATPSLPPAAAVLTAIHVAAMCVWVGGVVAYAITPSGRFGELAVWSAGLLVVSGLDLALFHLANPMQLVSTSYGVSLLVKALVVAGGLLLAWRARRRWELAALIAVLAVASVLVSFPPPR
jgi:copper transport protein